MMIKKFSAVSILGSLLLVGAFSLSSNVALADKVEGKVTKTERGGRMIHMGDKSGKISGSRTDVQINGKSGDREDIKVGMTCAADLKGKSGSEAKMISCK